MISKGQLPMVNGFLAPRPDRVCIYFLAHSMQIAGSDPRLLQMAGAICKEPADAVSRLLPAPAPLTAPTMFARLRPHRPC
jgi:hypothetical protein